MTFNGLPESRKLTTTHLFSHGVRLLVEVREQEVEHDGVGTDEVSERDRIVALVPDQQLESVSHHQDELNLGSERTKNEVLA